MRSARLVLSCGVLATALALAGCGGSGDDASSPSSPSPSPSASIVKKMYPKSTMTATASGDVSGPVTAIGDKGCQIAKNPNPGTVVNVAMGINLPDGSQATVLIGAAGPGTTQMSGESGYVVLIGKTVWQTSLPGGGGTATFPGATGRSGSFTAHMLSEAGGSMDLKGSFTCGR